MPFADSTASSFLIEELTGDKRKIALIGRALPYRPIKFGGKMRAEFTWYPGNPQATAQMLGASENETSINGFWKNRFINLTNFDGSDNNNPEGKVLLGTTPVTPVTAIVALFDDVRRKGQLLKVTWDEIARQGFLLEFVQTWHRHEDVEWEMSFQWVNQDEPDVAATIGSEPDQDSINAQFRALLDDLKNAVIAPFQPVLDFTTELNTALDNIDTAVGDLTSTVRKITDKTVKPIDAAQRTLATMNFITQQSKQIVNVTQERVAGAVINTGGEATTFGEELSSSAYTRRVNRRARAMRDFSAQQSQELNAQTNSTDLVSVFVARDSQDLRDVAVRFYGTQVEWKRIQTFNHLSSSKLTAGQLIFVPKLRNRAA